MEYLETTLGQSYSCSGQESLDLRPSQNESKEATVYLVQLKMRELVFQPFELGHNGSFVEGTVMNLIVIKYVIFIFYKICYKLINSHSYICFTKDGKRTLRNEP